jgi:PAS domain S-box-containing protein
LAGAKRTTAKQPVTSNQKGGRIACCLFTGEDGMGKPIDVLIVEDSEEDTLLIIRELKRGGFDPIHERIETAEAMKAALSTKAWDLILADYSMPHFSGLEALKLFKASGLDLPFIIVSGSIGEDVAVEAMKSGAHDYLMKNNLTRLVPAIQQELREAEVKRELKVSQNALQESEKRYRQVVENATEIIYALDEKGNFTYGNPAGLKVTGYSLAELRSFNYADLVVPDHRERVSQAYINQFRERWPTTYIEFPFFSKAGEIIWFGQNTSLVIEDGKVVGFHIIARDITERKKAEQALAESEQRYRNLVENAPDVIFTLASDGTIASLNPAFEMITGWSQAEWLNKTFHTILHPEDLPRGLELFQRIMKGEKIAPFELRVLRKSGDYLVAEFTVTPQTQNGSVIGMLGIARDITERKRIEEALQITQFSVEHAPESVFWIDSEGHLDYVNEVAYRSLGYAREELLSMSIWDIDPDFNKEKWTTHWQELPKRGPSTRESHHRTKEGKIFPIEITGDYLRYGEKEYNVAFVRDITDRKQAEERLRLQSTALEAAANAIIITDHEGMIEWANPAFTALTGYPSAEAVGKNPRELVRSGKQDQAFYKDLWDTILAGKVWRGQMINRREDGSLYTEEMTITPLRDERGGISRFIGIKQDITERIRAAETLRQSEKKARQLAQENAVMAEIGRIISSTLDIEEVYERFAKEVAKLIPFDRIMINMINPEKNATSFAYIAGIDVPDRRVGDITPLRGTATFECMRTRSGMLIQPDDIEECLARFPALLPSFQAGLRSIMFIPLISKDQFIGTLSLRSLKPKAYTDQDVRVGEGIANQVAGAIANAQLFTERVRAEQDKAALQDQLRQSQKMEAIGSLAGGIAHDFNNLLTVIKGYSQLSLMELKEGDPLKPNIEEVQKAAERAAGLTRQLLAFSRRQVMEMRVLDPNTLLRDLDKMLRRIIGEDIELVTLLADDLGTVKADAGQIEQVVMNLAVNARDAMQKGGKLTIETANVELDENYARNHIAVKPGPYVMLSVSDTGVGMTPEVRDRVFEPFFTTKEKGKGTGLGLSTVYGIVKQSGGNIWVYSEPGKGTAFKIYLPRVDEPLEEVGEKGVKEGLPRGSETVLVVEDEEEVRKLAVQILRRQGYTVLEASQGNEASHICDQFT